MNKDQVKGHVEEAKGKVKEATGKAVATRNWNRKEKSNNSVARSARVMVI